MGHAINHAYMKDTRGHVPWKQATHDLWGGGEGLMGPYGPVFQEFHITPFLPSPSSPDGFQGGPCPCAFLESATESAGMAAKSTRP